MAVALASTLLGWNGQVTNVADRDSAMSRAISAEMLNQLGVTADAEYTGQSAGRALEEAVETFLAGALPPHISGRPVEVTRGHLITDFEQYRHLADVKALIDEDGTGVLRATIGTDYEIRPDVTVGLRDRSVGTYLHAAVPCKWTIRSDRAQNVRHEAVTLIRNRRGRLPHIAAVTAEPLPTRLASLARGTGEVDAVYHIALDELGNAVQEVGSPEQRNVFAELTSHGRLRDLGDLPGLLTL